MKCKHSWYEVGVSYAVLGCREGDTGLCGHCRVIKSVLAGDSDITWGITALKLYWDKLKSYLCYIGGRIFQFVAVKFEIVLGRL